MSESAVSAKRSWVWFGAKPAQSEAPVGAALSGVHPEEGAVKKPGQQSSVDDLVYPCVRKLETYVHLLNAEISDSRSSSARLV